MISWYSKSNEVCIPLFDEAQHPKVFRLQDLQGVQEGQISDSVSLREIYYLVVRISDAKGQIIGRTR